MQEHRAPDDSLLRSCHRSVPSFYCSTIWRLAALGMCQTTRLPLHLWQLSLWDGLTAGNTTVDGRRGPLGRRWRQSICPLDLCPWDAWMDGLRVGTWPGGHCTARRAISRQGFRSIWARTGKRGHILLLCCWHALPGASKQSGPTPRWPRPESANIRSALAFRDTRSCVLCVHNMLRSCPARHLPVRYAQQKAAAGPSELWSASSGWWAHLPGCMSVNGPEVGSAPARSYWPRLIGTRSSWGNARQACFKGTLPFNVCTYRICHLSCSVACVSACPTNPRPEVRPSVSVQHLIGTTRVARRLTLDASVSTKERHLAGGKSPSSSWEKAWGRTHGDKRTVNLVPQPSSVPTHCSRGRHQLSLLLPTVCTPRPSRVCTRPAARDLDR